MGKKIIVIGAGIIGASIAYHLARDGADVTVIEKSTAASGATSKSFAWINAHYAETPEFFTLRTASISAWHDLEKEINHADFTVRWGGSLSWGDSPKEQNQQMKALKTLGYRLQLINSEEFTALEPAIRPPEGDCLYALSEGAIEPVTATRILLQAAAGFGAKIIYGCEVEQLIMTHNLVTGVTTPYGEVFADNIVVASGVWGSGLLTKIGLNLPMNNSYSLIIRTTQVAPVVSRVILSPDVHFRQDLDGSIIFAESFGGGDVGNDPTGIAAEILDKLRYRVPALGAIEIESTLVGNRPIPEDGFPAIGPAAGVDGLYLATMHSGITLAPITGKLVANEILNGTQAEMLAPYRPSRFV